MFPRRLQATTLTSISARCAALSGMLALSLLLGSCGSPLPVRWTHGDGTVMATGTVSGGKQTGRWVYYFPGGAKEAEGAWENDKQIDTWTWWYRDGTKRYTGGYAPGGLRDGLWSSWHPNGTQASTGVYRRDRQEGLWRSWHPDGGPSAHGVFANGVRQGWWIRRAAGGAPLEAGLYLDGQDVGPWIVNRDGTLTVEQRPVPAGVTLIIDGSTWRIDSADQHLAGTISLGSDGVPTTVALSCDGQAVSWSPNEDERRGFTVLLAKPTPVVALPESVTTSTEIAPVASDPSLTPVPIVPGFWTEIEKRTVLELIDGYTRGRPATASAVDGYDWSKVSVGDPKARRLIGTKMPQTRFLSTTGTVLDITRSGKPTVVVVMRGFSGQVCIYCASQTAALARAQQRFLDAGVALVVVYPGPTESVPAFVQAVQTLQGEPPPMPIGLDVSLQLVRRLQIEGNLAKPTSLVMKPDGTITYAYIGTSGADRPSIETLLKAAADAVK